MQYISVMRWLIYGHSGWIGKQICDLLGEEYCVKASSRADNIVNVTTEIEQTCPDRIICAIGRTHGENNMTVDYLEDKLDVNLNDNLCGPIVLAEVCRQKNIHLTYFGTGCIFKYDDKHAYDIGFGENDDPNFFGSAYSCVKGTTDKLMRNIYNNSVLNLRIRMPFSSTDCSRNFISKIIRYEKVINVKNSMTSLDEMIPIAIDMAKNALVGTYNMTQIGTISHAEILDMYCNIVDNDFSYTLMSKEEQDILNKKRSNNCLSTYKLEKMYNISNIYDAIYNCLQKWKKLKS